MQSMDNFRGNLTKDKISFSKGDSKTTEMGLDVPHLKPYGKKTLILDDFHNQMWKLKLSGEDKNKMKTTHKN